MSDPHAVPDDPIALALGAMAVGAAVGTGLQGITTWAVRTVQAGAPPAEAATLTSAPAIVLLGGTVFALACAGTVTWRLLRPVANPWRQTMLAIIAGFASLVFGLLAMPIDRWLGRVGLLGFAALALLGAAWLGGRVRRLTA